LPLGFSYASGTSASQPSPGKPAKFLFDLAGCRDRETTKNNHLGVATLFPLALPTRADELLPACLQGVAAISHHLQRTSLSGHLQNFLESRYCVAIVLLFAVLLPTPAKAVDSYSSA